MQTVAQLCQWWNLIYIVPFGLGVLLVLLSMPGTPRRGRSHSSARSTRHASHGRATAPGRSHAPASHKGTARNATKGQRGRSLKRRRGNNESGGWAEALHVQNIPPLMLLQNFLLFWGIFGWAANQFFAQFLSDPARFIVPSIIATSCVSIVTTVALSAVLSRFTPTDETFAVTKRDLIGRAGETVSAVTERMGSVYVRDAAGTLHHLAGRTQADAPAIAKSTSVLIIDYQPDGDYYWVKPWSPDAPGLEDSALDSIAHPQMPSLMHFSQIERPYKAWRWLVGSNPPSRHFTFTD